MAIVKIRQHLAQTGQYPPLCMLCGENPPVVKVEEDVVLDGLDAVRGVLGCMLGWIGLIYLAIKAAQAKKARVFLVLCGDCHQGRKRAAWGPALGILFCLAFWFLAGPLLVKPQMLGDGYGFLVSLLGGPILGYTLSWLIGRKHQVTCKGIDHEHILLNVPNGRYGDAYEAFMKEIGADFKPTAPGCARCQLVSPPGACFCKGCGDRLACSCGRPTRPQDAFCAGCGQKF